ncbi:MAG: hypothetical protein M3O34_10400 [Chloroflexota bacterium]|nr:hypothetical protein [Chloroflexota bacterium]
MRFMRRSAIALAALACVTAACGSTASDRSNPGGVEAARGANPPKGESAGTGLGSAQATAQAAGQAGAPIPTPGQTGPASGKPLGSPSPSPSPAGR